METVKEKSTTAKKVCVACRELIQPEARICPLCRSPQFRNHWKIVADGLKWVGGIAAVISLVMAITQVNKVLSNWKETKEAVSELVEATRIRKESNDYEGAWHLIEQALQLDPASEEARDVQVHLAMEWVRSTRMYYIDRKEATQKIEKLLPSLYRGAASSNASFASDVMAHIGWADWIRQKGDMYHLNVKGQFEKALEIDPENMYANTMMGHWLLARRIGAKDNWKKLDTAMKHFAVAIDSNRDRDYVRLWQFKALRALGKKGDEPVLQLANDLQNNKEELSRPVCREVLKIYKNLWSWVDDEQSEKELKYFVSMLRPMELLETYLWLNREINYEENMGVPYGYNIFIHKFIIARLTEETGNYSKALTQYKAVISQLDQMDLRESDSEWRVKEKFKRAAARVSQKK